MRNLIDPVLVVSWPNGSEMREKNPQRSQYGTLTDLEAPRRDELAASCFPSMAAVQAGGLADPRKYVPLSIKGDEQGVVAKKYGCLLRNHLHKLQNWSFDTGPAAAPFLSFFFLFHCPPYLSWLPTAEQWIWQIPPLVEKHAGLEMFQMVVGKQEVVLCPQACSLS